MMSCKHCGIELPTGSNPRQAFCKPSHRQAYFRERHEDWIHAVCLNVDRLMVEVEELRTKITDMEITIADQAQEIDELTSQITALRSRLDVERRYLSDITPYHFKSWLKKQAPSPFVSRMVADPLFPAHGPRSLYEAHVRRLHCSEEEHDDFVRLWKLMLLQA